MCVRVLQSLEILNEACGPDCSITCPVILIFLKHNQNQSGGVMSSSLLHNDSDKNNFPVGNVAHIQAHVIHFLHLLHAFRSHQRLYQRREPSTSSVPTGSLSQTPLFPLFKEVSAFLSGNVSRVALVRAACLMSTAHEEHEQNE